MAINNYKGIPKKFPVLINQNGDVELHKPGAHNLKAADNAFYPVVTSSGVLVAGYAEATHNSIGWNTIAQVTPISGSSTTAISYAVDAPNRKIRFSGAAGGTDTRRFSYTLYNPGLGTRR